MQPSLLCVDITNWDSDLTKFFWIKHSQKTMSYVTQVLKLLQRALKHRQLCLKVIY